MLLSVDEFFKDRTNRFVLKSFLSLFLPQPTRGNQGALNMLAAFRGIGWFYHAVASVGSDEEEFESKVYDLGSILVKYKH